MQDLIVKDITGSGLECHGVEIPLPESETDTLRELHQRHLEEERGMREGGREGLSREGEGGSREKEV